MLLEHFYTIRQTTAIDDHRWCIVAELNPEHRLYQGHFPEQPVVPGVCMLQLIKECVEGIWQETLQYTQIGSCKFLLPIDPTKNRVLELTLSLSEGEDESREEGASKPIKLIAEGKAGDDCFIKLKAQLIQQ